MRGAFLVGVMKSIYHSLGTGYFDSIFSYSVGIFEQVFFAADQPKTMEKTWREYVHGNQLINFSNPFRGKPILDLDYLVDIFQSEKSFLRTENILASKANLFVFLTDYVSRQPKVLDIKEYNVFDVMKAACALPIIYPKPVLLNGRRYVDGWLSPIKPFRELFKGVTKDFDEILAVISYPKHARVDGLARVISPSKMPLLGMMDTNQERIIATIKQGEIDGQRYIQSIVN